MIAAIFRALLVAAFLAAGRRALVDPWRGPRLGAALGCFAAAAAIALDGFYLGQF